METGSVVFFCLIKRLERQEKGNGFPLDFWFWKSVFLGNKGTLVPVYEW